MLASKCGSFTLPVLMPYLSGFEAVFSKRPLWLLSVSPIDHGHKMIHTFAENHRVAQLTWQSSQPACKAESSE